MHKKYIPHHVQCIKKENKNAECFKNNEDDDDDNILFILVTLLSICNVQYYEA